MLHFINCFRIYFGGTRVWVLDWIGFRIRLKLGLRSVLS